MVRASRLEKLFHVVDMKETDFASASDAYKTKTTGNLKQIVDSNLF